MKNTLLYALVTSMFLFACASSQAQVINLLNEDWSSGVRTVQDLPNSAHWYSSSPGNFSISPGSITQATPSTQYVIAYFTDGAPFTLDQGQTLQVNYSYSLAGLTGEGFFRTGVFNSATGNGRIDEDGFGTNESEFVGYQGYMVDTGNITNGSMGLRKRVSTTSNNLMSTLGTSGSVHSIVGSSHTDWDGLENSTIYNASLFITRNQDDSVTLVSILSDAGGEIYNVSRTDSSGAYHSFDTFAMMLSGSGGDSFTLYGVDISVIPEASTYAWMSLSLAAGMLAMVRRRRR
jgi:hypothetical protein